MVSTSGFILGLLGGLLDFASASMLLIGQTGTGMMGGTPSWAYAWAAILVALGALVIATTVLSVATIDMKIARAAPFMMISFGVIMVGIGAAMSAGYIESSGMSQLYSYGMVLVGFLMAGNGVVMLRGSPQMGAV